MAKKTIIIDNSVDDDVMGMFNQLDQNITDSVEEKEESTPVPEIKETVPEQTVSSETKPAFVPQEKENQDDSFSKIIKDTQIVVRVTEKEKNQIQSYFMKHGISISKGIKLAIKYLELQEEKGEVRFSEFGMF